MDSSPGCSRINQLDEDWNLDLSVGGKRLMSWEKRSRRGGRFRMIVECSDFEGPVKKNKNKYLA